MSAADGAGRFGRAPGEDAAPIGTGEIIAVAARHRVKIAGALLLPPLVALALLLWLPKTFRAQSDIVVKTGQEYMAQSNGEAATLTAPTSTKQESINSEIALLSSRTVIQRTIAAIGLAEIYPQIAADPPTSGTMMDAAVLRFARDLGIEPIKLSNVVSLSFDASSPALARRVLDTLIRSYIDKHTEVFASRRTDGYRDAIVTAMTDINGLEQRRSTLKLASGLFDIEAQRRVLIGQQLDTESRLEDAIARQAKLKARLAYLAAARAHAPATLAAAAEQSDARSHAAAALIDLQQQEAALAARQGGANPELQRLRQQINVVGRAAAATRKERNTTTGPSPLRQQIEADIVAASAELATTGGEIERLRAFVTARGTELARMERTDLELREIGLRIDVGTQNLRAMQGRFEQARANEQTDLANQVSVVQVAPAGGSERPVGPKALVLGAAGLFGGVLLAGMVGLLALLSTKTAVTDEVAERRVGLPVLAVVPWGRRPGDEPSFAA